MVVEKLVTSKEPIAFPTGVSKFGERARSAGQAVATRLVADGRDVKSNCLFAPFRRVPCSPGSSNFSDDVIMSFDIISK